MAPPIPPSEIIYQESGVSGHSRKNILTRLGGARNCLRLVVTKDVLQVTSSFPFSIFTRFYDLEHVVPRDRIRSVRRSGVLGMSVIVTFQGADGAEHTLRLWPWRQSDFLHSLGGETASADPGPSTMSDSAH